MVQHENAPSDRGARLAALLEEAAALDPIARQAMLERWRREDPSTGHELDRLLRAKERLGDFLEEPCPGPTLSAEASTVGRADGDAHGDPLIGRTIGHIDIRRRIDRGGTSSVYEGWHLHLGCAVAVKVLRPSRQTASFARRLEREARLLARLDHPGIARVLDSGTFDLGDGAQPFIVMELIDGAPLYAVRDTYREQDWSVRTCASLIAAIARAIQHAHDRAVLHRDIKPGNVLVTRDAAGTLSPKVLDFGLSRLDIHDADAGSLAASLTDSRDIVGTLRYMSPEQLAGNAIVRSDIYALGVVGFELISGQLPYPGYDRANPSSDLELLRIIRDPARHRLSRVDSRVDAGLSAIFASATAADPARRYPTAADLADDLEAWLDGRPLKVRPRSRADELAAFLKRHRTMTIAALLCVLLLIAGSSATAWQALRARHAQQLAESRFEEVRGLARSVLFELEPAIARLPGTTVARHLLADRAISYLDGLEQGAGNDPEFVRELAEAWERIANILGSIFELNLGRTSEAAAAYRRAIGLRERLPNAGDPREVLHRAMLTYMLVYVMDDDEKFDAMGNLVYEPLDRAIRMTEALHGRVPDVLLSSHRAMILAQQSIHLNRIDRQDESIALMDEVESMIGSIDEADDLDEGFIRRALHARSLLAMAAVFRALDSERALRNAIIALTYIPVLRDGSMHPMLLTRIESQLKTLQGQAFMQLGDMESAFGRLESALALADDTVATDPDDFTNRRHAEVVIWRLAAARITRARQGEGSMDQRIADVRRAIDDLRDVQERHARRVAAGQVNFTEHHYPEWLAEAIASAEVLLAELVEAEE